jgi:ceramide glucosyltransferase
MAWMLEGVKLRLVHDGYHSDAAQAVGGFHALADYLADDFGLEPDREGRLRSSVIASRGEAAIPTGFKGMMRHQMRWARSTRISRPMGYLGLIPPMEPRWRC